MIRKIVPSLYHIQWLNRLDTQLIKETNQNSINVPKVVEPTNKKKTLLKNLGDLCNKQSNVLYLPATNHITDGLFKKGKCVNSLPSTHFCVLLLLSCLLIITLINELQCLHNVENSGSDPGKKTKVRVSSYFHSSFFPISCGGSNPAGQSLTFT